jgi:hypothetical protein
MDVSVGALVVFVCWEFDEIDALFVSDLIELLGLVSFGLSIGSSNDPTDVTAEIALDFFTY